MKYFILTPTDISASRLEFLHSNSNLFKVVNNKIYICLTDSTENEESSFEVEYTVFKSSLCDSLFTANKTLYDTLESMITYSKSEIVGLVHNESFPLSKLFLTESELIDANTVYGYLKQCNTNLVDDFNFDLSFSQKDRFSLDTIKEVYIEFCKTGCTNYIKQCYPTEVQTTFNMIYFTNTDSVIKSKIETVYSFITSVVSNYHLLRDIISECSTIQEVKEVYWDYSSLILFDNKIRLSDVL